MKFAKYVNCRPEKSWSNYGKDS